MTEIDDRTEDTCPACEGTGEVDAADPRYPNLERVMSGALDSKIRYAVVQLRAALSDLEDRESVVHTPGEPALLVREAIADLRSLLP